MAMLKIRQFIFSILLFFLIISLSFGGVFELVPAVNGANQGTITVQATVLCGDGVVDAGETCDAGVNNGVCPKNCSATCTVNNCGGGGGDGGDDLPPTISNVVVTVLGATGAKIAWNSNDDHDGFVVLLEYGLTENYGTTAYNAKTTGTNVVLNNLLPNTKYYYKFTVTDSISQKVFNTMNHLPPVI